MVSATEGVRRGPGLLKLERSLAFDSFGERKLPSVFVHDRRELTLATLITPGAFAGRPTRNASSSSPTAPMNVLLAVSAIHAWTSRDEVDPLSRATTH